MKAAMLFTGSGPIVILTSYASLEDPALLKRLDGKGISKFLAFDVPIEMAEARYGGHFQNVLHNLHESDDLRVLDYNGQRAMQLFSFKELGEPVYHEAA
ncbi:cytosolic protein [Candidatus Endoriftia persephone]|jgi:hypothetical protein|uniref:Cytosolic protein n=2 Tax=Gammaproteobacteria TaxID=1236 RepID=A0A9J7A1L5_9GAMM|nr:MULTISPECIES: hypothetical protein [sulfur-oxidizing symbionts]USF88839.1 cytosolic protein [Candidatus Endoriftia persephone]